MASNELDPWRFYEQQDVSSQLLGGTITEEY
jgi:hypothetical protein